MKIVWSLLLFPIILLAQMPNLNMEESFHVELSMKIDMEHMLFNMPDPTEGAVEIFVVVEIGFEDIGHENPGSKPLAIPQYLTTFSLFDLPHNDHLIYQEDLNESLAITDPMHPKENTLFDWLSPARYQSKVHDKIMSIPKGFGTRLLL